MADQPKRIIHTWFVDSWPVKAKTFTKRIILFIGVQVGKLENGKNTAPTFEDTPRAWVCFDADDILTPVWYNNTRRAKCRWYIENHLPHVLRMSVMFWQLSGQCRTPEKPETQNFTRSCVELLTEPPHQPRASKSLAARDIGEKNTDFFSYSVVPGTLHKQTRLKVLWI